MSDARNTLTRRSLVGGAAAGTAGLALGGIAERAGASASKSVDCIVIGAGLSGLSAAHTLRRAGKSFVVLEARDRVGGRTLNGHLGHGRVVEIGGQWVGPTQNKPFWRDDGFSGMATSDLGPIKLTFDNTPHGGRPGILLGFIEGQEARDLLHASQHKRRKLVLDCMARYFGSKAHLAKDYADKSWAADPWTRGCYGGYYPPGVLTGYREAVSAPVGAIHWAGTETASEWNGYMDGALQSGERAAEEVLAKP